jgi:hypothetical protein
MATSSTTQLPADRWWMRQPGGQPYGPVAKADLDRWYAEGRISPQCQVLYEPQQAWRWAAEFYPALAMPPGAVSGPMPGAWPAVKPAGGPPMNPTIVFAAVVDLLMGLFHMAYSALLIIRSLPFLVLFSMPDRGPSLDESQPFLTLTVMGLILGIVGLGMGVFTLVCAYATSQKRRWGRMANYALAGYFVVAAIIHAVANGMFHPLAACMLLVASIGFAVVQSILLSLPQVSKEFS